MRIQRGVFRKVLTMGRRRLGSVLPRSHGKPLPVRRAATATVLVFPVREQPPGTDESRDSPLDYCLEIWEQIGEYVQPALFVARVDDD